VKVKRLLQKVPFVYELVQSVRDEQIHRHGITAGTFAQHGEDVQLLAMLTDRKAIGPYLDLGSNHPFILSNSYLLYRSGWQGLCVDPLPRFRPLYAKWRPRDQFHCVAIGETSGTVDFFEFEWDALSTLDGALARNYVSNGFKVRRKIPVEIKTVDQLLEEAGFEGPLSLFSIDIEGHELSALRSMNLKRWQPAVICIEALTADGGRNQAALDYLSVNGYKAFRDLGLNMVFVPALS